MEWKSFGEPRPYGEMYRRPLQDIINPLIAAGFILRAYLPEPAFEAFEPLGFLRLQTMLTLFARGRQPVSIGEVSPELAPGGFDKVLRRVYRSTRGLADPFTHWHGGSNVSRCSPASDYPQPRGHATCKHRMPRIRNGRFD